MVTNELLQIRGMGVAGARHLIDWLNENRSRRKGQKLSKMLESIRRATDLKKEAFRNIEAGITPDVAAGNHLADLLDEVNESLISYKVVPQFAPPYGPGRWWHGVWAPVRVGSIKFPVRGSRRKRIQRAIDECDAAIALVTLTANNRLDRVRQCRECGSWFFVSRPHQRFDRKECQQKNFRSTPEFKEARREYMRRYRELDAL
jgi:hypothetical protein